VSVEEPPETEPLADTPFLRAEAFGAVAEGMLEETPVETVVVTWQNLPEQLPTIHLLAPWRELQPRLRREVMVARETKDLDVAAVVRRLGERRLLQRVLRDAPACRSQPIWTSRAASSNS